MEAQGTLLTNTQKAFDTLGEPPQAQGGKGAFGAVISGVTE
jgi:hypothetical protein